MKPNRFLTYSVTIVGIAMVVASVTMAIAAERVRDSNHIRSRFLVDLVACRSLEAPGRLGCYDTHVAALDRAEATGEVLLIDKVQTREVRRGIFGLSLPGLARIFGDGKGDAGSGPAKIDRIEAKIQRIDRLGNGRWVFLLEDGARWVQTDSLELATPPKAGQPIVIRKAAMGSYLANINGQRAIRVHREN